ncbi:SemiSWEET family transporter [Campylobacter gracilis]|uniref:SemiSWEET family transporter n=1 Tax=Campylobacter gracilis TaxID=824 RepID=UPI0026EE7A6B|nr:SemiSWEET family transporter [Campylobacter gracilis]
MSERNLQILGWAGTCLSVIMYVSYVPNIMANLDGNKVPFLQPLAAAINCTIWVSYGLLKPKKRTIRSPRRISRGSSLGY